MTVAQKGTVYLVGAGPGDPDLLTLKAADLLRTADVVLHDDLVTQEILDRVGPRAIIRSVGKRCGRVRITQEQINALMIEQARSGRSVIRLKSGDPLIFGRAGEEMEALEAAGIPFEVVPGITAVSAAAAAVQKSLTDRRSASRLILTTAHHAPEKGARGATSFWRGMLPDDATLAIYMPGQDLQSLAWEMLQTGLSADLPCVVIRSISRPEQEIVKTTVENLANTKASSGPLLVLAGRALGKQTSADCSALALDALANAGFAEPVVLHNGL